MPNYKSKMLTFLSIGEMTGLLLDNTDEDGILFAVATDSTNFKIVMWRKTSTATVDNETVYPANGPGRWHVLATGKQEVLTIEGDVIPSQISGDTDLVVLKKIDGTKEVKVKFNGVFEDLLIGGGSGLDTAYYSLFYDKSGSSEVDNFDLPYPTDPTKSSFAIVRVYANGESTSKDAFFLYYWDSLTNTYYLISERTSNSEWYETSFSNHKGVVRGQIRHTDNIDYTGGIQDWNNGMSDFHIWNGSKWLGLVTVLNPPGKNGMAGIFPKVEVDGFGLVKRGMYLVANDIPLLNTTSIPSLDASKINSGVFDTSRIPNLSTSKITSGVFNISFIPTGTTSTTVALGNHTHTFNDLSDVVITSPVSGHSIVFNGSAWVNQAVSGGGGTTNLDGLTDVVITSPVNGNTLVFNGTNWINQTQSPSNSNLDSLTDVIITSPVTNNALIFNGTNWVNQTIPGSATTLDGLTDVTITSPIIDHVIAFDGSQWINKSVTGASNNLDGLTDVDITAPSSGDVLTYNGTNWVNEVFTAGSEVYPFVSSLSKSNISINSPTTITITGQNFTLSTSVTIPNTTVSNIVRNSPTSISLSLTGSVVGTQSLILANGANTNMAWDSGIKTISFFDGDPYTNDVTLLIRGNGTNGSTSIVDESNTPKTITLVGNTSISTAQSKYGGSSIYFDGTGDLLQLANTTAFNFAGNNFTFEFWIYPLNSSYFVGKGDASSSSGSMFSWTSNSVYSYYNGGTTATHALSLSLNAWQHIAVVRNGTSYILYKNGVSHSTVTLPAGATLNSVASPLQFGGYAGQFIQAYFDSIRVTNLARYTSAFNPETDTYLNL